MNSNTNALTREGVLKELDTTWDEFQAYLTSLTEEQLTRPTDAAGWTAKDHIIHVAMWEKAELALLNRQSKREAMDITEEVWEQDDDPINAVIQERYRDMPLAEVIQTLRDNHESVVQKLNSMSDADLQLPYNHYKIGAEDERPFIMYVPWDTYKHYRDHMTWIAAIVNNA